MASRSGAGVRLWQALQVVIALALPLALVALAPGDVRLWAGVVLVGEVAFAALNGGWVWLVVPVAAVSLAPVVVQLGDLRTEYLAGSLSLGVGTAVVVVVLQGRTAATDRRRGRDRVLLTASIGLLIAGLITLGLVLGTSARTDAQFAAGQEAAQAAFASASASTSPSTGGDGTDPVIAEGPEDVTPSVAPEGTPIAAISFERPSTGEALVSDGPLVVGEGTSVATLARGPGHYSQTSPIGQVGNTAIAGHRTGWGSYWLHLDDLTTGDVATLRLPDGTTYRYEIVRSEVVDPDAAWVLGPDPLGTGVPTLTLTTCDPPHTDERRLVVFAQLKK